MSVKTLRCTYQIKVTLNGVKPPIWRRIQIPSDITLGRLHTVLQIAMGWTNSHLHQFISGRTLYGVREDDLFGLDVEDENKYKINDLLKKEKNWVKYEYDFGDSWEHKILLEKILAFEKNQKLPICIEGKRACPPEDCGGIWGYQNLLEILQDPKHEEYEEFIDWLGGGFDPEIFDIAEINNMFIKYVK